MIYPNFETLLTLDNLPGSIECLIVAISAVESKPVSLVSKEPSLGKAALICNVDLIRGVCHSQGQFAVKEY